MKIPEYVQQYKIHMDNGDVVAWFEDVDADPGLVDFWGEYLCGKNKTQIFVCESFLGPYACIPYKNISWIEPGNVEKVQ